MSLGQICHDWDRVKVENVVRANLNAIEGGALQ